VLLVLFAIVNGVSLKGDFSMKAFLLAGVICLLGLWQGCTNSNETGSMNTSGSKKTRDASGASISDIQIIGYHIERKSNKEWMITGEIKNNSKIAIGVELKYTCYDEKGWPVAGGTWWDPKPGKNVPAGSTWPIKNVFPHEGNIKKMTLGINTVRIWVQKKSSAD
jgi:hypothetical protein